MTLAGVLVGAGLLAVIFPAAFLKQGDVHFEVTISKQLFLALIALLVLVNTYMVTRHMQLQRVRQSLISTTIQSELVRLIFYCLPHAFVIVSELRDPSFS
jgi:hypothetical protein